ncbi:MAG TPA: flagella assembly protein FlgT middle domain-containing protein [Cellvibrio sp.]|nr:flagella assembly protein FlgT middle domain-containing protein [Cellvibrio sp.]
MGSPHLIMRPLCGFLLTGLLLTSFLGASSAPRANSIVPDDIAFKPQSPLTTDTAPDAVADVDTQYLSKGQCPDQSRSHDNLQKSLVIARFLRATPYTANAGNLYAAESGLPEMLRVQLYEQYQTIGPAVLQQGFAAAGLTDAQLKQQAQKIARQARTQFVVSGTILNMGMYTPDSTYRPTIFRQTANAFHDLTHIEKFDKRDRVLIMDVQLRDGFTGELLLSKIYATSGIWNNREAIGFNSPAFFNTPYGEAVRSLTRQISQELAQVIHCQPFMAAIDAHAGQAQILLHGGANNGLHAGDSLNLYQVVMVGSNSDYQVADTRLVKRETRLHLSEVYPSHSIAVVEGGSYLTGHYVAASE